LHSDPLLPALAAIGAVVILVGLLMRKLGQPSIIGYMLCGILLGPHVLAWLPDEASVSRVGQFGVVLLLFFVGMEMSPQKIVAVWRTAVLGTLLQVAISIGCVLALGVFLDWRLPRILVLGFVISLSSTAVVIRLLKVRGEFDSPLGNQVMGILLAQDIAIIPMLLAISFAVGEHPSVSTIALQAVGGLLCLALVVWIARKGQIRLGFYRYLGDEPDLQVFGGLILCFGIAAVTGFFELSTALGAFLGGMVISAARETGWIHETLEPFRAVFVAAFFLSIGMLLDLGFLTERWVLIGVLTVLMLLLNTTINAVILRMMGEPLQESVYGGALLAQAGELGFLLAVVGKESGAISEFTYDMTLALITVSILLSPVWAIGTGGVIRMFLRSSGGNRP
jgi:CPA2 family monovalent cation:H+ antiporter-2